MLLCLAKAAVNSSAFSLKLIVNPLSLKIVRIHGTFLLFWKDLNTNQYPLGLVDGSKNFFDKQKEYWKLQKWCLLLLWWLLLKHLYAFFMLCAFFLAIVSCGIQILWYYIDLLISSLNKLALPPKFIFFSGFSHRKYLIAFLIWLIFTF